MRGDLEMTNLRGDRDCKAIFTRRRCAACGCSLGTHAHLSEARVRGGLCLACATKIEEILSTQ